VSERERKREIGIVKREKKRKLFSFILNLEERERRQFANISHISSFLRSTNSFEKNSANRKNIRKREIGCERDNACVCVSENKG